MKKPRVVIVDHLQHGEPKKIGLFGRTTICDYMSPEGLVREYHRKGDKVPEYRILKTGEKVKVNFSFSMIEDMDDYFNTDMSNDFGD